MTQQKDHSGTGGEEDQEKVKGDASSKQDTDAPGKGSDSGYPNDGYWDDTDRDKPKEAPAETPEPEQGYRWQETEEKQGAAGEKPESDKSPS